MERYESKQVRILQPAAIIFNLLSDFTHLTPIVGEKVEGWNATADSCSFKVKGFDLHLQMVEREAPKLIKITGDPASPLQFTFWLQLVGAAENDTRMRIVLDVELPMMLKMMVGGKLSEAVNRIAEQIAEGFNRFTATPPAPQGADETGKETPQETPCGQA